MFCKPPTCGLYHRIWLTINYKSSWIPMQSSCHAACEAEFDYLLLDWPEACGRCKVHFDKARYAAELGDPKNTMAFSLLVFHHFFRICHGIWVLGLSVFICVYDWAYHKKLTEFCPDFVGESIGSTISLFSMAANVWGLPRGKPWKVAVGWISRRWQRVYRGRSATSINS